MTDKQNIAFWDEYGKLISDRFTWTRYETTPLGLIYIEYGRIHTNGMQEKAIGYIRIDKYGNVARGYNL